RGARATAALTEVSDPSPCGVVPTRDDGTVVAFVEKPAPGRAPSNWINAGIYVLEPDVLARIPPGRPVSIERQTFPQMLEGRGQLYAQGSAAYWIDIGTPASFVEANLDVVRERLRRQRRRARDDRRLDRRAGRRDRGRSDRRLVYRRCRGGGDEQGEVIHARAGDGRSGLHRVDARRPSPGGGLRRRRHRRPVDRIP